LNLALGTVQFGSPYGIANQTGQVSFAAAKAMLQLARAYGVDTLDTAIAYGDAEATLGKIGVEDFRLVTKLPARPEDCRDVADWMSHQFSESRKRLGVNTVYALLLHRSSELLGTDGNEVYRCLERFKGSGLVRKIGVSIYGPEELDALLPRFRLDLVQAPLNLIDRRLYTSGWLQRLKQTGIEVHTRSAFLQGLLLMSRSDIPSKFEIWAELWDRWHCWLDDCSISSVEACLAYPLSFSEVDRVVVGADSVVHLQQIIEALNGNIDHEFLDLHCDAENLINPSLWPQL
jgi:aryl-alcohol dehydrogenase-like predicted oxidoreductase